MLEIREITSGLLHPQEPVAMNDGRVIVTELQTERLVRVQMDSKKEIVAETVGKSGAYRAVWARLD